MTGFSASSSEIVDTNLLIYAVDASAGTKHIIASQLVRGLLGQRSLALSVQILNEFYAVATRPGKSPGLSHDVAAQMVRDYASAASILPLTREVTLRAVEAVATHGLSFWDALVWAVARENGIGTIYSEDFQHGRVVEGVRFVNPFVTVP